MGKLYIKNCCYFCTEREVNCKGCAIAKEGLEAIKKQCQKHITAGICTETFGDKVNKNLCFTPDDKDIEELEGKSTSALSVNNREEEKPVPPSGRLIKDGETQTQPSARAKPDVVEMGEKEQSHKETKEDRTNKIADALKELSKNGEIDIKTLLEKLGDKK